jgi:ATP-dependent DNA helicase RecG
MTGDTLVGTLPFVGPKYQQLLEKLGIKTLRDLLYHIPSRYQDLSRITRIDELAREELQVIEARVWDIKKIRIAGGRVIINVSVGDSSGTVQLTWFNQPFIERSLRVGETYRFAGEVEEKRGLLQMSNPQFEPASKPMLHTGRIVPIYHQTAGITSKWLRARIAPLLSKIPDLAPEFLPDDTRSRHQLPQLADALFNIHAPASLEVAHVAKRRLGFDELLVLQLQALRRKGDWEGQKSAHVLTIDQSTLEQLLLDLPFTLTQGQITALQAILTDMAKPSPMNRLLEGDVGSGKTVVAAMAALVAHQSGHQVAIMAPTAVLAQQHFVTKMATADVTVGTHALLSEGVDFDRLGLVVIDEQHRFGVEQRATLMAKAGHGVHLLAMTATPIPRSLALTLYGDLDLSVIDELPIGRIPIKTHVVPDRKRADCYGFINDALSRGEQAYVICPLVEESENLDSVRAATTEYEKLKHIFAGFNLGLLHGRMKAADKDAMLGAFSAGDIDLLVSTPVVEVGIDVPNASMMIIEGAERFGLAQLHQLRGRVGRGKTQSYCFLFSDASDPREVARLRHLEQESRGIRLAEVDLETRGPGEIYGVRQSGLPELHAASLFDYALIEAARAEAELLYQHERLIDLPLLQERLLQQERRIEMN